MPSLPKKLPRSGGRPIGLGSLLGLLLLLATPVMALSTLAPAFDWRILTGAPLAMSLFTWFAYRSDKRRAESGAWRIPESTLHLAELCGGWPGAFLAQRYFRHKTAKLPYQIAFWAIVALHELLAADFLNSWRLIRQLVHFANSITL